MRCGLLVAALFACTPDEPETEAVPDVLAELGASPTVEIMGNRQDGLQMPRDLEFHPDRPDELWVVNREDDSVVIYFGAGTATQASEKRIDQNANHFMEEVSSLAFGDTDETVDTKPISTFASCQESRNTYDEQAPPNDFMGPALWPGDLDLFAVVEQVPQMLGSHIDMLHSSPNCMGIAHVKGNKYWVFDGLNNMLVWYDFQIPHGYGEDDHSDGKIRRYSDVVLTRVADIPGHIVVGPDEIVYIADTGTGRVLAVDTSTAEEVDTIPFLFEELDEYTEYKGAIEREFATGLVDPSGLVLVGTTLYVSEHGTGDIIGFDVDSGEELGRVNVGEGVMGLALGPDGHLWYTNGLEDKIGTIIPG